MNYEKIDLLTNNAVEILPSVYSEALSYSDMLGYIVSQLNTVEELVSDLANNVADAPGQAELDAIIVEAGQLAGLAQEYATIATQLAGIASTKAMEASGYATAAFEKAEEAAASAVTAVNATAGKANAADVYLKSEVYTKTEVDTKDALKADKATTYTKTEVDTKDATKADKTEVAASLGLKADKSDTYSKTEVDGKDSALSALITDLEARSLKKYGVRRVLGATSPLLERLYDSVGKIAQVPTDDGVAVNDFDAIYPWSLIRECKIASGRVTYKTDPGYDALTVCDWMVEVPKFYLRIAQDASKRDIVISQYRHAGFWLPQVFRTESGAELDKIYVGRFKTGKDGSTDVSRPGLFAENLRDLASFRAGARAKGAGWQQIDLSYVQEVLYPLYMIESATLHSQDYLGSGLTGFRYVATDLAKLAETGVNRIVVTNAAATNYNVGEGICIGTSQGSENIAFDRTILSKAALPDGLNTEIVFDGAAVNIAVGNVLWQGAQKTGQTVALTKPSGKLSGTAGRRSHKYRGLEDLFGNVYEWVDGVLISERIAQVCRKPSLYASTVTADYKPVGYTNWGMDGYPKEMGWDENFPEARFPVSIGAGTTTGYCDYYYQSTGLRGAYFGGGAGNGADAGLFYWHLRNAPTGTNWNIGSRLMYKGV